MQAAPCGTITEYVPPFPRHSVHRSWPFRRSPQSTAKRGASGGQPGPLQGAQARALLPLTVPEIRRLLARLRAATPPDVGAIWRWSRWRRRHQASARSCHYRRRAVRYLQL
jgi:hypothetical protein